MGVQGERLGEAGERLAAAELARRGWTILARNYRHGRREVDLVARRGEVVAFVEVKARSGRACGHPLEAITPAKQREIGEVAHHWVARFGCPGDVYRFDAIAVHCPPGQQPLVEHLEDAWGV